MAEGVLLYSARTVRHLSDVSADFTRGRGPLQTTLAGVPKCLWVVARGLWMIPRVYRNFARCTRGEYNSLRSNDTTTSCPSIMSQM